MDVERFSTRVYECAKYHYYHSDPRRFISAIKLTYRFFYFVLFLSSSSPFEKYRANNQSFVMTP